MEAQQSNSSDPSVGLADTSNGSDDVSRLLLEAGERAFGGLCTKDLLDRAEAGEWPVALWEQLDQLGFSRAVLPEDDGGAGLSLADSMRLARLAAHYAVPLPLGETLVAAWCLQQSGLSVPEGPLAFGPLGSESVQLEADGEHWRLGGTIRRIPWGDRLAAVVLLLPAKNGINVARVIRENYSVRDHRNIAGEPRCDLHFEGVRLTHADVRQWYATALPVRDSEPGIVLGAMLRAQQMAGALERVRDLSVQYASERVQFGKPLNRLPAVQQNLAIIAGQAAAAKVAADLALDALASPDRDLTDSIAASKTRTGEAVGIAARLAHQVHGAMGFTYEHQLHHYTRRLWAWRDECGNERHWAALLGRHIIAAGADALWSYVTRIARL
ncbi:acyl-CoA dehydrogenase family protein [Caballeronia sp. LZ001]|uniref:acyl-CoA dehydrogenase family protein n=1 Tax=Caballeronia sp. LZ001 TaxID=3038553 RepID=UPI0028610E64|nr:acyl-CoA dehydrogenase family protein [Caballeronia sp. LZ001]MDR5804872.1 acyl-CoA/acyl-ACP dehydrogenase [Caballeronia sp. LZ001]